MPPLAHATRGGPSFPLQLRQYGTNNKKSKSNLDVNTLLKFVLKSVRSTSAVGGKM